MIEQLIESFNSENILEVIGAFTFTTSIVIVFLITLLMFIIKLND
jgi:hypothetical protein